MDKPADYRITVQGVVPESWLDRLGGVKISAATAEQTTLEGRLPDQAALHGVLDTLYGMNLLILEVTSFSQVCPGKEDPGEEHHPVKRIGKKGLTMKRQKPIIKKG